MLVLNSRLAEGITKAVLFKHLQKTLRIRTLINFFSTIKVLWEFSECISHIKILLFSLCNLSYCLVDGKLVVLLQWILSEREN